MLDPFFSTVQFERNRVVFTIDCNDENWNSYRNQIDSKTLTT